MTKTSSSQKKTAVIQSAKIYDVLDLWKRKPKALAFNDTDVIVLAVQADGKTIEETFFTCLKPNGTFAISTPSRLSHGRRQKLANFISHYFHAKNPEKYNVREENKKWKGATVELDEHGFIFIP
ncbi:hypothetical protein HZB00_01135 [Candidatus Woesearchaeota archaeon]|nr:hypothetical protein [Candidatus Woesearchaeota archaeon]